MTTYTHMLDLAKEAEPPADGILSRMLFQDDRIKAVVFGFAQGQELSEHTAAKPAMRFFVMGEASVGLDEDLQEAQAGTWVYVPAGLKLVPVRAESWELVRHASCRTWNQSMMCIRIGK